jgi:hypothetical protein
MGIAKIRSTDPHGGLSQKAIPGFTSGLLLHRKLVSARHEVVIRYGKRPHSLFLLKAGHKIAMKAWLLFSLFLLFSLLSLHAQELPAAPHVISLTFLQLTASTADALATYRNDSRCYDSGYTQARCTELNPIAGFFVMKGTLPLSGYFVGETCLKLAAPLLLDHYGRHKLARAIRYWGIGDNAAGAAMSFAEHHR